MVEMISQINSIAETWFDVIFLNSLQIAILFVLLFGITSIFRKGSSVFLYSLWMLFILKAVLLPVLRVPFLQNTVLYDISAHSIVYNSSRIIISPETGLIGSLTLPSVMFLVWIAGIITLLVFYIRNEVIFNLSLRSYETFPSDFKIQKLQDELEIKKPVVLRISHNVPAPFTKGLWKPVIYLPVSVNNWSEHQLKSIICHELTHIKRRDIIVITLQNILNVLYFFHPMMWMANHQINFHREKICDDTAIALLNSNPSQYGRTLMNNLESFLVNRRMPIIANGLFFSKKTIIKRFEYLLNRGKEIKMKLGPFQKLAILALGLLVIITACNNGSNETPLSVSKDTDAVSPSGKDIKYVPYDTPPEPIGGFRAIQENVKYPKADMKAGIEGTVIVQAYLDENGDVTEAVAIRSPGIKSLEKAAIEAIKKTKFKPAMQKEKPVGVYISIPVLFKLKGDDIEK